MALATKYFSGTINRTTSGTTNTTIYTVPAGRLAKVIFNYSKMDYQLSDGQGNALPASDLSLRNSIHGRFHSVGASSAGGSTYNGSFTLVGFSYPRSSFGTTVNGTENGNTNLIDIYTKTNAANNPVAILDLPTDEYYVNPDTGKVSLRSFYLGPTQSITAVISIGAFNPGVANFNIEYSFIAIEETAS